MQLRTWGGLALALGGLACPTAPDSDPATSKAAETPGPSQPGPSPSKAQVGAIVEAGIASHYADSLAGRPTASGEPYDPQASTCAHRSLPMGTVLQVTAKRTGKEATCRVNDRGPFVEGRILDVSRSVAEALHMDGLARVEIRRVKRSADQSSR